MFNDTTELAVAVQPLTVTVTVKVPGTVVLMNFVVAPVLHKYVPPPDAVIFLVGLLHVMDCCACEMEAVG